MPTQKNVTNRNASRLIGNYNKTDGSLKQIKGKLEDLDQLLGKVLDIIAVPRDVSEGFSELDDTMERVISLLEAAMIILPITKEVKEFHSQLDRLRSQKVHRLREKVNNTEENIAPYRKYKEEVRAFFQEMEPLAGDLDRFIQNEHRHVIQTDSLNNSLKDGRYKRTQMEKLEKFSTGINRDLADPMKTLDKMIEAGKSVETDLETIDDTCKKLSNLFKPELSLLEKLAELEEQLTDLNKALEQNVTLIYYTISIRFLYKSFAEQKAIPFADRLAIQAEKTLQRQLENLDLDVQLSTPGIDNIEGEMLHVLDNCKSIEDTMNVTRPQMTDIFKHKCIETKINSHDA